MELSLNRLANRSDFRGKKSPYRRSQTELHGRFSYKQSQEIPAILRTESEARTSTLELLSKTRWLWILVHVTDRHRRMAFLENKWSFCLFLSPVFRPGTPARTRTYFLKPQQPARLYEFGRNARSCPFGYLYSRYRSKCHLHSHGRQIKTFSSDRCMCQPACAVESIQ